MSHLRSFWQFIRSHKYIVTLLLFAAYLAFVDDNSLVSRYERWQENSSLQDDIDHYRALYEAETARIDALDNDPTELERVARECYYMQRDDEDVYVVVSTDNDSTSHEATL